MRIIIYKSNYKEYNITITIWGNSTLEGMKKLLLNSILSGGTTLLHSNKFNVILNDINRYLESKDNKYVLYNFADSFGFTKTAKSEGR